MLKILILIGQLGRIWAKNSRARRIYQSISVLGFFSLLYKSKNDTKKLEDK